VFLNTNFWERVINIKWDTFNYYFNIACTKVRINITRTMKAPWINKNIVIAKNQLKDLYNISRLSQMHINHVKKKYNLIIRTEKANYIQNIIIKSKTHQSNFGKL
jgi:hypothetical protein